MTEPYQIVEYSSTAAALAELRSRYAAPFDVATAKGMALAKEARAEVRGYRTALETLRKEIKAPALERCRLIDDEAKRITPETALDQAYQIGLYRRTAIGPTSCLTSIPRQGRRTAIFAARRAAFYCPRTPAT